MKKLQYSITINAPKERVWDAMLEDKTYRQWTTPFKEGSYYEGSWEKGSEIKFLAPGGSGMLSVIRENKRYEYISIEHIGLIHQGVEDRDSVEAKRWTPAFENYTLSEKDGQTTVSVDMEGADKYEEIFQDMWPKALQLLKEISEKPRGKVTVEVLIHAPVEKVWKMWTGPEHITHWCFASDDWECPYAENDLRVEGRFKTGMAAKDRSAQFDFTGTYSEVQKDALISYAIDGGRKVTIIFERHGEDTKVIEAFEVEGMYSEEQQRSGWRSILDNFKNYVEQTS